MLRLFSLQIRKSTGKRIWNRWKSIKLENEIISISKEELDLLFIPRVMSTFSSSYTVSQIMGQIIELLRRYSGVSIY